MPQVNILIVSGKKEAADTIELHLVSAGYQVYRAGNAEEGFDILDEKAIHLVILGMAVSGMDSVSMCRQIRKVSNIPIIMISERMENMDKIIGLGSGADDYVTEPVNPLEVVARVGAQLRRYMEMDTGQEEPDGKDILSVRGLVMDRVSRQVKVYGEEVRLTPIEFDVLYLLASNPGKVFSTDEIFSQVWRERVYEANNTVMVHIRRLRGKMKEDTRPEKIITTVWGVGYKIEK
ncbi:response regulator transcription factor [Lacrimispora sp. NSJ-141]|uniref:Stage 0 sporulation protein A homolog n=1 Tax=Lientehia hominis TaxID=2897778 RepID=A0AAP2RHT5_9FIRM|nr:response regulator transcription factor [Lientehia hominis]MCD2491704.1 response regulator transcription factor [Lientehia hominis]